MDCSLVVYDGKLWAKHTLKTQGLEEKKWKGTIMIFS